MPKDECDPEDPWELNLVAVPTEEDTLPSMAETFVEEFMRMGYGAPQILALFRNPNYVGPHTVRTRYGEGFVRELIARVFQRWGRTPDWRAVLPDRRPGLRGVTAPPGGPNLDRIREQGEQYP